jgi:hypothetical protein
VLCSRVAHTLTRCARASDSTPSAARRLLRSVHARGRPDLPAPCQTTSSCQATLGRNSEARCSPSKLRAGVSSCHATRRTVCYIKHGTSVCLRLCLGAASDLVPATGAGRAVVPIHHVARRIDLRRAPGGRVRCAGRAAAVAAACTRRSTGTTRTIDSNSAEYLLHPP